jgi:hypothetical protein
MSKEKKRRGKPEPEVVFDPPPEAPKMSLWQKLRDDYYKVGDDSDTPPYPSRDPLLSKKVFELTADEQARCPALLADYQAQKKRWDDHCAKRQALQNELEAQFWADVYAEFGLDPKHPFVSVMVEQAWDDGHSAGLGEVASCLLKYVKFWETAVQCGMKREVGNG